MAIAFAIYSSDDNSLDFYKRDNVPNVGDIFDGKTVAAVYTGFEDIEYSSSSSVPWYENVSNIVSVDFIDEITPVSMARWFRYMANMISFSSGKLDTSKVASFYDLFFHCTNITSLDLSKFDTSNVTDMSYMFQDCHSLRTLSISGFDTSKVTSMKYMFDCCYGFESLDLSNFNTSNVTDMSYMFRNFAGSSLNLSSFNTSNVANMECMFNYTALRTLDLSNFNTEKVSNFFGIFSANHSLTELNVSNFSVKSCNLLDSMFSGCALLETLDLSSFNTSNITNMSYMFNNCTNLKTIYVDKWSKASLLYSTDMFSGCTSLIGDIAFDSNYIDATYATYDGGYLTYKKYYAYTDESSGAYKPRMHNNNVDLEKILDMILALGLVDVPTLITFTIGSTEYQAEEGMTWAEWVESEYNTGGYIIYAGAVTNSSGEPQKNEYYSSDVIQEGGVYNIT